MIYDIILLCRTTKASRVKTMASPSSESEEQFQHSMAATLEDATAGSNNASPNVSVLTPKKPGRPKQDDILQHVTRTLAADSTSIYNQVCKHCGKSRTSAQFQSTFWSTHLVGLCDKAPLDVRREIASKSKSKEVKRMAAEAGVLGDPTMMTEEGQPIKKQRTPNFSPKKKRGPASKIKVKIDKITEKYFSELKALKALASMSDDPAVYDEGKRILNLIADVEQSRVNNGI
jgi:hypothetical protein